MNVTHIPMGRPWIFDCIVHNDGEANTYNYWYKGQTIMFTPLKLTPTLPKKQAHDWTLIFSICESLKKIPSTG